MVKVEWLFVINNSICALRLLILVLVPKKVTLRATV